MNSLHVHPASAFNQAYSFGPSSTITSSSSASSSAIASSSSTNQLQPQSQPFCFQVSSWDGNSTNSTATTSTFSTPQHPSTSHLPNPSIALWVPSSSSPSHIYPTTLHSGSQIRGLGTTITVTWGYLCNFIKKFPCGGSFRKLPGCLCTIIILSIISFIIFIVVTTPNFSIRMNRRMYPKGQLTCYSRNENETSVVLENTSSMLCPVGEYCYNIRIIQNSTGDAQEYVRKGCDTNSQHWLCSYNEDTSRKNERDITHQCWSVHSYGNRGECTCTR